MTREELKRKLVEHFSEAANKGEDLARIADNAITLLERIRDASGGKLDHECVHAVLKTLTLTLVDLTLGVTGKYLESEKELEKEVLAGIAMTAANLGQILAFAGAANDLLAGEGLEA